MDPSRMSVVDIARSTTADSALAPGPDAHEIAMMANVAVTAIPADPIRVGRRRWIAATIRPMVASAR